MVLHTQRYIHKKTLVKQLWVFIFMTTGCISSPTLVHCGWHLFTMEKMQRKICVYHSKVNSQICIMAYVTMELFSVLSLQPEEYGQEAMEGQGEAMLDPEGETYDESQQVIRVHETN